MKRLIAVSLALGLMFCGRIVLSECKNGCKVVGCAKNSAGTCWQASPASCMKGYWRFFGNWSPEGHSYVCEVTVLPEFFVKSTCNDCNPTCPQNGNGEATYCTDCTPVMNPQRADGKWPVKECEEVIPATPPGGAE
jgi:hypothetical protein